MARAGVKTICYNFMVITDWTRTELEWKLPSGGYALRFDAVDFAAYDLFVLRRKGADADYTLPASRQRRLGFKTLSPGQIDKLEKVLIDWLPARDFAYDRAGSTRCSRSTSRSRRMICGQT